MSILIFAVVLIILIIVHELGHFSFAKFFGVRVDEFGIGYPPKIIGKKIGKTEYSLNWLPFGGFVKIFGEDADEKGDISEEEKKGNLTSKPKYVQALVLFAGVLFNLIFAWLLISFGLMSGLPFSSSSAPDGAPIQNARLTVVEVVADSPAEKAGLKTADIIQGMSTKTETLTDITPSGVSEFISRNGNKEIAFLYERSGESDTVFLYPSEGIIEDIPAIGISMDIIGILKLPFFVAFWEGMKVTAGLTWAIIVGLFGLIIGMFKGTASLSAVTGPVGIVGMVGDAAQLGFVYLLGFTAFISINLAIINLFPLPALDGGRLLFLLIEKIKGSPINPKLFNVLNNLGFIFLIIIMLVVTFRDIVRLF